MSNPIANPGQFSAEAEVREMWQRSEIKAAREHAAQLWLVGHGNDIPEGLMDTFDSAMDGWVTNYLFKAAAMDPMYPRFVRDFMPAYEWNGQAVPDARMGGDNPDNCYRVAGIKHGESYVVRGQVVDIAPAQVSFTLVENWGTSITVQTLEFAYLEKDAAGHFTITIDDQLANGRPNHLTTNARVKFLFVRDSMMDWSQETPLALEIERQGKDRPEPLSQDDRLDEGLRQMRQDVPLYYWFFRLSAGKPVNTMPQPFRPASVGGLVTQASSIGRLHLEDDQAAIVRYDPAGADYHSLNMVMWWYRSLDAHERQSGLTGAMTSRNADGTITCVVSKRDPGIDNWIDTVGQKELLPMIRWQGLPESQVNQGPRHWLEIVKFDDLDRTLGQDVRRIDAKGRAQQLADRRAAWNRRTSI